MHEPIVKVELLDDLMERIAECERESQDEPWPEDERVMLTDRALAELHYDEAEY